MKLLKKKKKTRPRKRKKKVNEKIAEIVQFTIKKHVTQDDEKRVNIYMHIYRNHYNNHLTKIVSLSLTLPFTLWTSRSNWKKIFIGVFLSIIFAIKLFYTYMKKKSHITFLYSLSLSLSFAHMMTKFNTLTLLFCC